MALSLNGIIPPLATPLNARDQLDHAGLQNLVEHVLSGGVSGIFVLGTTGEAPSLSYGLRRELITEVCRIVAGRVPVLAGITDTSFVESVRLAEHAACSGADALVLSTPYYFPAGQTELADYVRRIVPELPLPLMLYNIPILTKVWFEIETLRQLADLDRVIGVKDSGGDLDYFAGVVELKQKRPDWSVLIGPEALLPQAMERGADGGVAGGSNLFPDLFVQCYEAAVNGQAVRVNELQTQIELLQQIYDVGKYASRFIKATKSGLSLLGICQDVMAEPFHHFFEPERARVKAVLDQIDTGLFPRQSAEATK